MKFSIGDKIILNRTGEEGVVTAYVNNQMVEVEVNGTNFPVYLDEIDHPYLKWFTEKKEKKKAPLPEQLPVEKARLRPPKLAKGIYMSFLPVFKVEEIEDIVDYLKVYLFNELPVDINYSYDARHINRSAFQHEGKLHAFGHVYLHNIPYDEMNDQPRLHWQVADAGDDKLKAEEGVLRIKPLKLFEHINDLLLNNQPMFSYLLTENFVIKPKPEKPETFEPPVVKPFITARNAPTVTESPKYELDLHIERLIKNKRGLSNADMLQVQLDTLQHYLQLALLHRQDKMFIIHGIGKGVLKEEVHKILRRTKHIASFNNSYHGLYGYGATEVYFKT
jgi:hypothetical protein